MNFGNGFGPEMPRLGSSSLVFDGPPLSHGGGVEEDGGTEAPAPAYFEPPRLQPIGELSRQETQGPPSSFPPIVGERKPFVPPEPGQISRVTNKPIM
jgi:hypothetical protein